MSFAKNTDALETRPLTLHLAALNDSEYGNFMTSLSDLLQFELYDPHPRESLADGSDSDRYHSAVIDIREARSWLCGRYIGHNLHRSDIDTILKLISPNTKPLSGGQFFAALRLITHVTAGRPVDAGLVFVQSHPGGGVSSSASSVRPTHPSPPPHNSMDHVSIGRPGQTKTWDDMGQVLNRLVVLGINRC